MAPVSTARTLLLGLGLFGSMACFCLPFGAKPTSIGFTKPEGPITQDVAVPLGAEVLELPSIAIEWVDEREAYSEPRMILLGMAAATLLAVVFVVTSMIVLRVTG